MSVPVNWMRSPVGEGFSPARGLELVILAQLAALAAHLPDGGIDLAHIGIGVGEHEAGFDGSAAYPSPISEPGRPAPRPACASI